MWGSSEEPPGTMEAGPPEMEKMDNLKDTCEQNKNQLETLRDIMQRNKQSLKKKEEELQEFAKKLSKVKTRVKASRVSKDNAVSSSESTPKSKSDASGAEPSEDVVDDISQAKTPKAKSSLLQKKLAEDKKIIEQRNKELTDIKKAMEEKVEALRQQLEEKYVAPVSVVNPVLVTSQSPHPVLQVSHIQDKDNKIMELSNKIFELEATIIDLQENLKEKDSVIDSKTKAITLMSADLSKKGKTTLDTLEDTKDEMRSMQENFVLVETSLRNKNDNLIKQLEEKNEQITKLEENVQSLMDKLEVQKQAEVVSADFSRSTMDTLADTKDAMKSMQENFVLIESSLKSKTEHLLKQLEEREIKLAEAEAKILNLEAGIGIERQPNIEELMYKNEKLEEANRMFQDEKYELQKSFAQLQDRIISSESTNNNNNSIEKDNRITELENLVEELKKSNQALEEALQSQINNLNEKNTEMSNKIIEFEKQVLDLQNEKVELTTKLTELSETEVLKEDERVQKLTKELEDLNKKMIKLQAQHKNKLKNVQKQLDSFKKVSDTNAELVKLANQVTLLEEEKGNLQLSLVDFDELKASAGDWQARISDLEGKVSTQAKEIQTHIKAIAILENQKLDLMQELHAVKQEVSSLEAENADLENLRVTAEMKVVNLEEELESLHKLNSEPLTDSERSDFQRQIENLTRENERLSQKISKLEELKGSSEVGSTDSFVKTGSNVDSTESFEAFAATDADKADLLKKIDGLTRENGALLEKLTRFEEKGSSDTGSTESFERIPEQGESTSKLENLTRENYELVVKLTKLEEKLAAHQAEPFEAESRLKILAQENERLLAEISQLQERLAQLEVDESKKEAREKRSPDIQELTTDEVQTSTEENRSSSYPPSNESASVVNEELIAKIESLTALNENLTVSLKKLEKENHGLEKEKHDLERIKQDLEQEKQDLERVKQELVIKMKEKTEEAQAIPEELHVKEIIVPVEIPVLEDSTQHQVSEDKKTIAESAAIASLESEIERCSAIINEQNNIIEEMKTKLAEKEVELEKKSAQITSESEACDLDLRTLRRELEESTSAIAEWKNKCAEMETKLEILEQSKRSIEEGFQALQNENKNLLEQSEYKDVLVASLKEELDNTISGFEAKMRNQSEAMASQEELIQQLRQGIENKDQELQAKYSQLQINLIKIDELQDELNKLHTQVQQRDATITSLTEEVEALRTNTSVVEEDLFVARHQLTDLHEKLEHSKSVQEYNQVMERLNDKEMMVEELESKMFQKIAEVNTLKSYTEILANENEQLRGQLQEEEHKIADLLDGNRSQEEAMKNSERAKAEVENRLLDLQAEHDENLRHAKNTTSELQNAYKMLEQLKIKHTEDIEMLNRRLEDLMEEVLIKTQEINNLQSDLDEKNDVLGRCVPEDVQANLMTQIAELERKLTEADKKAQAQIEKMKKYAAVAKKKTAQCEELETKLNKVEEKLNLEKNEKEIINKQLQESLSDVQDKCNKITDMEEELRRLQNERDEGLHSIEAIKIELNESRQKINTLSDELKELSETKERARELGVRMEVMESEYVEQLAQINSLKTENGFLISKQTQIIERLENVEKESEERRAILEKLEKEKEIAETEKNEIQETCGQCATRVLALEAKLQERDAEIENLDNELHNSIGNLVQMQENLRLSTIASPPDPSLQESYNELMMQYNNLTAASEEIKAKYEAELKNNEELSQHISKLQELNNTSYENINAQYVDLVDKFEKQKAALEEAEAQLKAAKSSNEATERQLLARIEQLEQEKKHLIQECKSLKGLKDNIVPDDGWELDPSSALIDIETQQQQPINETLQRQKRELEESVPVIAKEETPPLFDASVFGASPPHNKNLEKEIEISKLKDEISKLNEQLEAARILSEQMQMQFSSEIEQARITIESLTLDLNNVTAKHNDLAENIEAKNQILSLKNELSVVKESLILAKEEFDVLNNTVQEKNSWISKAENEKANYVSQLEQLSLEKQELERFISHLLSSLSIVDESSSNVQKLQKLEAKLGEIISEFQMIRAENQQLHVYKNKVFELENEMKTSSETAVIAELENRIARVTSDRNILQLQLNDVTHAFEDLKESTEGIKNLQSQLQAVSQERNQLAEELKALRASAETTQERPTEELFAAAPKIEEPKTESMWDDDEDVWGLNDKTIPHSIEEHVHIPVIPSKETELQIKIDEIEDKLKEVTEENAKLLEESKIAQVKNVKYVKKLKEYKVQFDSLQHQLKSQKSIGGLGADLDSAIEEELKAQVENLEKALIEAKEETKKVLAEKDNLLKRIDVLTAATERFTEVKEKQDTEVHIWQMRYKDLEMKLQQLDSSSQPTETHSSPSQEIKDVNPKYEAEIKELKDNIDALAAENEELQQLLEENRTKRQVSIDESAGTIKELQEKNSELIVNNEKLKSDYDTLRKQYEQSLMDANDQVQNMRQNCELLKSELIEKNAESEKTIEELNERLSTILVEKEQLETKVHELEADVGKLNSIASSLDEVTELLNARGQEIAGLKEELKRHHSEKSQFEENIKKITHQLTDELNEKQTQLDSLIAAVHEKDDELFKQRAELEELRGLVDKVKGLELSIEGYMTEIQEKNEEIHSLHEKINRYEATLAEKEQQATVQQSKFQQSASEIEKCTRQLQALEEVAQKLAESERHNVELNAIISEKSANLERSNEEVKILRDKLQIKENELQETKNRLEAALQEQSKNIQKAVISTQEATKFVEDVPMFTFDSGNSDKELQQLKNELKTKNEEIEHLQYSLNENSMTRTIQELQDNVNALYNEKTDLENQIIVKNQEINGLKSHLEIMQSENHQPQKRSLGEQEELMKLQNELHSRDQQINELKFVITEKESQLRAVLEQASSDFESHESAERLRSELYEKQQEMESLKFTVSELQSEVANLRGLERLAAEDRATIERLNSEKEEVRQQAEEAVERILKEKKNEMDALKQQLAAENQHLMVALGIRERDLENLKLQIEQTGFDRDALLEQKTEHLARLEEELSERDRRLAELSITKDTEIHNLQVQLSEKSARLDELIALTEEEEKQLTEMRNLLETKEQQINELTQQLEEKSKEYELIEHALQRHIAKNEDQSVETQPQQYTSNSVGVSEASSTNQLDIALYMLHQRDVRCEELTLELMQLLEERDALQLRLSNAIRVNEELRKHAIAAGSSPRKDSSTTQGSSSIAEPLVENPSPSKSEGPVEIAKEAINLPVDEDSKTLAQKLSQLKTVNQGRDVRLKDERELRHSQQMSFLLHGNLTSPTGVTEQVHSSHRHPPGALSQSRVAINQTTGKSKVLHM